MKVIDKDGRLGQVAEAHMGHVVAAWKQVVDQMKQRGATRQDIEAAYGLVTWEMGQVQRQWKGS